MSKPNTPSLEDYEAIAAAVMETERGRWFLEEFARRNRAADTAQILAALAQLETRMRLQPGAPAIDERIDRAPELHAPRIDEVHDARPAAPLMLTPPTIDPAPLAVAPPLAAEEADASPEPAPDAVRDAPARPRAFEAEWGRRGSQPLRDASQPRAAVGTAAPAAKPAPLLESLSEAEKALLFA